MAVTRAWSLRVLVPARNAIVGIALAATKQMAVVTDHDRKGHRAADVPVPRLGSWPGAGLGGRPGRGGGLGGTKDPVRCDHRTC
jgi:hypothetical protein